MITIYGYSPSYNTRRVLFTAEEVGLKYNYVHIDIVSAEQKTQEHLNRHPLGKTPVIETENGFLIESHAISRYLANFGTDTFYPRNDPWKKAQVDQWCEFIVQGMGKELITYLYEVFLKDYFKFSSRNEKIIQNCEKHIHHVAPHLEYQLERYPYIAGTDFTFADIIAWSYIETSITSNFSFNKYPNILLWINSVRERPSIKKISLSYPLWSNEN